MKLFKYALIALTTAQTVHLEDLGADDPFSYLDYYMDGDYYEDYQEELDYQIGARAKKKGSGYFYMILPKNYELLYDAYRLMLTLLLTFCL